MPKQTVMIPKGNQAPPKWIPTEAPELGAPLPDDKSGNLVTVHFTRKIAVAGEGEKMVPGIDRNNEKTIRDRIYALLELGAALVLTLPKDHPLITTYRGVTDPKMGHYQAVGFGKNKVYPRLTVKAVDREEYSLSVCLFVAEGHTQTAPGTWDNRAPSLAPVRLLSHIPHASAPFTAQAWTALGKSGDPVKGAKLSPPRSPSPDSWRALAQTPKGKGLTKKQIKAQRADLIKARDEAAAKRKPKAPEPVAGDLAVVQEIRTDKRARTMDRDRREDEAKARAAAKKELDNAAAAK